jgi:hypothetical protein
MNKILYYVTLFLTLSSLALAKDWWLVKKEEPCTDAKNINGLDFRPESLMQKFPTCFIVHSDGTNIALDCTQSPLSGNFVFTSSKILCEQSHSGIKNNKGIQQKIKGAWWLVDGKDCKLAIGIRHPEAILKDHPQCTKDEGKTLVEGLMLINCTDAAVGIIFSKTRSQCEKANQNIWRLQMQPQPEDERI